MSNEKIGDVLLTDTARRLKKIQIFAVSEFGLIDMKQQLVVPTLTQHSDTPE